MNHIQTASSITCGQSFVTAIITVKMEPDVYPVLCDSLDKSYTWQRHQVVYKNFPQQIETFFHHHQDFYLLQQCLCLTHCPLLETCSVRGPWL